MGIGKTYWARRVANYLGFLHHDTDEYIEKQEDQSIQLIINERGESKFRQLEKEALRKIVSREHRDAIISLGGGTLLDEENLKFVKDHGTLIWLKGKPESLHQDDVQKRPLYDKDTIDQLYLERKASYLKADVIIDIQRLENEEEIERFLIQHIKG